MDLFEWAETNNKLDISNLLRLLSIMERINPRKSHLTDKMCQAIRPHILAYREETARLIQHHGESAYDAATADILPRYLAVTQGYHYVAPHPSPTHPDIHASGTFTPAGWEADKVLDTIG